MRTLTLEQVREAGRRAGRSTESTHFEGYAFRDGRVYRVGWQGQTLTLKGNPPLTGWHHLPGCDCPYCS